MISVRIKSKDDCTVLSFEEGARVCDLKNKICSILNINVHDLKILYGFPRKPLNCRTDNVDLTTVISNSETLIVEDMAESKSISYTSSASVVGENTNESMPCSSSSSHVACAAVTPSSTEHIIRESVMLCKIPEGMLLRFIMPANNSCLFTSINFVVTGGKVIVADASFLRGVIADCVGANPKFYNSAVLGKSNREYSAWIKREEHWGGAIELSILCQYFNLEIVVIDKQNKCVHRFGQNRNFDKRVFLIYNGSHYDAIGMKCANVNEIQTIFPSSNIALLQHAKRICEEPAVSDEEEEWLCVCKTCGEVCKTQREVVDHAVSAFHYRFSAIDDEKLLLRG